MELSTDLISQFVKATTDNKKTKKEETVYGTIAIRGEEKYVKLDGSDLLTPISATADTEDGDRVTVMIKNHTATVTGNISSPAARVDDLGEIPEINDKIEEFDELIAKKVDVEVFNAEVGKIGQLQADDVVIKNRITANEGNISKLKADDVTIKGDLTASNAKIKTLQTEKLDASVADIKYATVVGLDATNADIHNLEATYGDFEDLTTKKFTATDASIKDLTASKLSAKDADLKYANIDFSNIGKAALEEFFAKSGLIENVIVGDATISGNLVGVTISGDLIEGNTVVADKLVIKGTDGLYYKLNTDGMKIEAQQTDYNSVNGSVIKAKSITASKITVGDLVAFGATIGGLKIADGAIYSGVKESVDNSTNGIYLNDKGEMSIGGTNKFVKFYRDATGVFKLDISADSLKFGSKDVDIIEGMQNIENTANDAKASADETSSRLVVSESMIQQISNAISMLVSDSNGSSLMTQTSDGWTFNMSSMEETLHNATSELNKLSGDMGDVDNTIRNLASLVDDLSQKTAYITMSTDPDGNPCIELGRHDSPFKVRITNTAVDFMEGVSKIAYVNNKSLYIKRAVIKEELQIGEGVGLVWKRRSNGNIGLMWTGG